MSKEITAVYQMESLFEDLGIRHQEISSLIHTVKMDTGKDITKIVLPIPKMTYYNVKVEFGNVDKIGYETT